MEESIVHLQLRIAIPEDKKVFVSSIVKAVEGSELNKKVLGQILEAIQEDEVLQLCGDKNARNQNNRWRRAGTSNKAIGTRLGKDKIKLAKVRDTITNNAFKPLMDRVEFKGKKVYQDDVSILGVELASKMTYWDASKEGKRIIEEFPSPHTINRRAKEYGEAIVQFNRSEVSQEKAEIVMADGTKVHGMHKSKNEVKAIIGCIFWFKNYGGIPAINSRIKILYGKEPLKLDELRDVDAKFFGCIMPGEERKYTFFLPESFVNDAKNKKDDLHVLISLDYEYAKTRSGAYSILAKYYPLENVFEMIEDKIR